MTAKAVSNASDASGASRMVTNLRCLPARRGFPSGRCTPARHLPGSRSKARTINPLYSTLAPRRSFRRCEGTTTLVSESFQHLGENVVLYWNSPRRWNERARRSCRTAKLSATNLKDAVRTRKGFAYCQPEAPASQDTAGAFSLFGGGAQKGPPAGAPGAKSLATTCCHFELMRCRRHSGRRVISPMGSRYSAYQIRSSPVRTKSDKR